MNQRIISQINIYPVKSLGGISIKTTQVEDRGLQYDRRWMLVDESGRFLTQRILPQMALFKVELKDKALIISHKTNKVDPLMLSLGVHEECTIKVQVWDDCCNAFPVSGEADKWFSSLLGIPCRLVYMPEDEQRLVDTKYASHNEIVSFADAYPFLIIGQSSLDDLNGRLAEKVPMNRFRPNFVFTGGGPYEEDKWKTFKAGPVLFHAVKPCSRCVMTTTDQNTAERNPEPLRTLSTYRSQGNKVLFGQNLLHESKGTISVGDVIEIVEWKDL